jgi:hypothetical protein
MCGRLIPQEWASFELYTSQEHAIRPTGGASHLSFSWWWSRGRFIARLKGNSDAKNLLHRGMCSPYVSDLSFMDYWVKYTVILKLQQVSMVELLTRGSTFKGTSLLIHRGSKDSGSFFLLFFVIFCLNIPSRYALNFTSNHFNFFFWAHWCHWW